MRSFVGAAVGVFGIHIWHGEPNLRFGRNRRSCILRWVSHVVALLGRLERSAGFVAISKHDARLERGVGRWKCHVIRGECCASVGGLVRAVV